MIGIPTLPLRKKSGLSRKKMPNSPETAIRFRLDTVSFRGFPSPLTQGPMTHPIRRAATLLTVALFGGATLAARQLPAPTDVAAAVRAFLTPARLEEDARRITADDRLSGSPGENAAIDYIVSSLKADGVPVEVHTFNAYTSDPISAKVEILTADGAVALTPHAITVAFSGSVDALERPLVDVGDASDLPGVQSGTAARLALNDAGVGSVGDLEPTPATGAPTTDRATPEARAKARDARARLHGAIALVTGTPGPDEAWALEQLGAAGAVFINPADRLNDLITTTVWGSPSTRDAHRVPRLPVTEVTRKDGDAIRARLAAGPLRARLSSATRLGWKPLRLAVARIPAGLDPSPNAPYVLFGGHIDAWYKGGTDEGASNAAMLELARGFYRQRAQLRRGLVVAWWPGHSNGRYAGSTWFADHQFIELRDRAIAYVNVDGIGQKDAKTYSSAASASLAGLATNVVRARAGAPVRVRRPGRDSDESFNGIGLPLLQFNHERPDELGGYWWWHTPDDTFDKIDFNVLKGDAGLYADAIAALLTAPTPPIDMVAEVTALGTVIHERQIAAKGKVDFTDLLSRQARLLSLVRRLEHSSTLTGRGADLAMVRILRPIHRVVYTLGGAYHPDPAIDFGELPGLAKANLDMVVGGDSASDAGRFTMIALVRERNRLLDALDQSIAEAERVQNGAGAR